MGTAQMHFDAAVRDYEKAISILDEIGRISQTVNPKFNLTLLKQQFDVVLQLTLFKIGLGDNTFCNIEGQFIEKITQYADLLATINDKYGQNLQWGMLTKLSEAGGENDLISQFVALAEKVCVDSLGELLLFAALAGQIRGDEKVYLEAITQQVSLICQAFMNVDGDGKNLPEMISFVKTVGLHFSYQFDEAISAAKQLLSSQRYVVLKENWQLETGYLNEDVTDVMNAPPYIAPNFYISSYICPSCHKNLYKTVFPIGKESPIKVNNRDVFMKRLFTCQRCLTFYTPVQGQKLSVGQYYALKLSDPGTYNALLKNYNEQGGTAGRSDA